VRIALAQLASGPCPRSNLRLVAEAADRAVEARASLLVTPEATMRCFGSGGLATVAEPTTGPWASEIREIAAQRGLTVVTGMFTPAVDGRVANTLLVARPDGTSASYNKIHLFDAFGQQESDVVAAGDRLVLVDVDGVQVGLAVCYDLRFPALFTALAARGAQVIVVAASWADGPGKASQWELLVRARAADSTAYVLACDQARPNGTGRAVAAGVPAAGVPAGIGRSLVADPWGEEVASLGPDVGVLVVELDPATVADAREAVPVLRHARPVDRMDPDRSQPD
jgi:predicted amidohydrolase